jgi:hypothetical protein
MSSNQHEEGAVSPVPSSALHGPKKKRSIPPHLKYKTKNYVREDAASVVSHAPIKLRPSMVSPPLYNDCLRLLDCNIIRVGVLENMFTHYSGHTLAP